MVGKYTILHFLNYSFSHKSVIINYIKGFLKIYREFSPNYSIDSHVK